MKSQKLLPPLLIAAAVSLALCFTLRKNPNTPCFIPVTHQPPVIPGQILYNYTGAAPFANGTFWIYTGIGTTNVQAFLFDVEHRKIIGELLNCQPGICNRDHTKLFYTEVTLPAKAVLSAFLAKIFNGHLNLGVKAIQSTSILNLTNNHIHRLESHQMPGNLADGWTPSPHCRFAINNRSLIDPTTPLEVCDLDAETIVSAPSPGDIHGWWNDAQLLVRLPAGDLQLYNVQTKRISSLITREAIQQKLDELQITNAPNYLSFFTAWNGTNLAYFLTDATPWPSGWPTGKKGFVLLKLGLTASSLSLFARHFDYSPNGEFDPSQTHFLYVGNAPASKNRNDGAVYLADLIHNTTTTLFPPLTRDEPTYPRFYGTNLIYVSSNQLWMTTLDAKTQTRLYPPPQY